MGTRGATSAGYEPGRASAEADSSAHVARTERYVELPLREIGEKNYASNRENVWSG